MSFVRQSGRNSLAVAVAFGLLARRQRIIAPEEAFTFGLLADIGRLALATAWPEEYSQCLAEATHADLQALERKYFSIDHRELSCLLLADWKLPRSSLMP